MDNQKTKNRRPGGMLKGFFDHLFKIETNDVIQANTKIKVILLNFIIGLIGIPTIIFFAIRNFLRGEAVLGIIYIICASIVFLIIISMNKTKDIRITGNLVIISMSFLFLFAMFNGKEDRSVGAYLFPLFSIFLLDTVRGAIASAVFLIICIIFFIFPLPFFYAYSTKEAIRFSCVYFFIGLFTAFYNYVRSLFQQIAIKKNNELITALQEKIAAEEGLRRSNKELEQFAYSASHDLQEPLRKVNMFSEMVIGKNRGLLDEQSIDYLTRMQKAAERMQKLIDSLLSYSRITSRSRAFELCDLNTIMKHVLSDLEVKIAECNAQITVKALPVIHADPVQMEQLFQNLVGNAVKYHRQDIIPQVTVSAENKVWNNQEFTEICVTDNGIGFNSEYREKIFEIFQRLVNKSQYDGTGIGLSICKKIVERHSGSITAESIPGEGSTFIILLPVNQRITAGGNS